MRLVHTKDLELHEFISDVPLYAILSHTWQDEEVTFDAFQKPSRTKLMGWAKIQGACTLAANDGWDWIWIDTCCIDKSNLAELSEAINSMFRYYEESEICYAYLSDVKIPVAPHYVYEPMRMLSLDGSLARMFKGSTWFTRGWTLQELLAPRFLLFVDRNWNSIGNRDQHTKLIQDATGIQAQFLDNYQDAVVSTRLSWASKRKTTRKEDQSYCLLGLLDVNMPLLYGEGTKAFRRLLLEVIKVSNDQSMFCWNGFSSSAALFPPFIDQYDSGFIHMPLPTAASYSMTNAGLSITTTVHNSKTGSWIPLNVAAQGTQS